MFPNTSGKDFNNACKMSRNLFYIMIKGNQISGANDTHNDEVTGIFCCKFKKKIKFFKSILKAKVKWPKPKAKWQGMTNKGNGLRYCPNATFHYLYEDSSQFLKDSFLSFNKTKSWTLPNFFISFQTLTQKPNIAAAIDYIKEKFTQSCDLSLSRKMV